MIIAENELKNELTELKERIIVRDDFTTGGEDSGLFMVLVVISIHCLLFTKIVMFSVSCDLYVCR